MGTKADEFPSCDIAVWSGPSIFNFEPRTPPGDEWLWEECDFADMGGVFVAEPRFAMDIIAGAVNDGLLRVALDGRLIESIEAR